jgi:hypothetical protein
MAVPGARSSYDLRVNKQMIGGRAHGHPAPASETVDFFTSASGLRSADASWRLRGPGPSPRADYSLDGMSRVRKPTPAITSAM